MSKRLTNEEFLAKARAVHGDKYEYLSEYTVSNDTIYIECKIHGKFSKMATLHIQGAGCQKCARRKTHEQFVTEANEKHNNKYTYPDTYVADNVKIIILCPDHGPWSQIPS